MFKESDHVEFVSAFLYQNLGLELSNQVQRFFEVNFIRCFPT